MKLKFIFKGVLLTWMILWMVFLIQQSKRGQYDDLAYFYTHEYSLKVRYLLGDDLADFLSFCAVKVPFGSTYDLRGFEKYSIKEVRSRYYLWPLYRTDNNPDFVMVCGSGGEVPAGYKEFEALDGKGRIYAREGAL